MIVALIKHIKRTERMMKKLFTSIVLICCMVFIAGCGSKSTGAGLSQPNPTSFTQPPAVTLLSSVNPERDALIWRNDEGFIEVCIEDDAVILMFDFDQWEDYNYLIESDSAEMYLGGLTVFEGPFVVWGLLGGVADVCIGTVGTLDWNEYGLTLPAVLFLMEDSSVEWLFANPFTSELVSFGALPWLNDIVSVTYEKNEEDDIDTTFIAENADGLRVDVRTFCYLSQSIFANEWIHVIGSVNEDDMECIFVSFGADGGLSMRKGLLHDGDSYAFYIGHYEIILSESAPVMLIELWDEWKLDMSDPDFGEPPEMSGTYGFEADSVYFMLFLTDGEPLHRNGDETPVTDYLFWQLYANTEWIDIMELSDGELIDYLINTAEGAYERVYEWSDPLTPIVTGDMIELDDVGLCRLVYLGTDHIGHFVKEIQYAVSDSGLIYEYDPLEDIWNQIY